MNKSSNQFLRQKSEIYNSSQRSSSRAARQLLTNDDIETEAVQIQNLKEVLNARNSANIKMHAKSSQGTFHTDKRRSTDYGKKSKDFLAHYSLPEHHTRKSVWYQL